MKFNKKILQEVSFYEASKEIFRPIYEEMALILSNEVFPQNICLDIGTGSGILPIYLKEFFDGDINIYALDKKKTFNEIISHPKQNNIHAVKGDTHYLPFQDNSFDLIMSRGSLPFWENSKEAFNEIERVGKRDGKIMIGGGLGFNEKTRTVVRNSMSEEMLGKKPLLEEQEITKNLQESKLSNYKINKGDYGFWILKNIKLGEYLPVSC